MQHFATHLRMHPVGRPGTAFKPSILGARADSELSALQHILQVHVPHWMGQPRDAEHAHLACLNPKHTKLRQSHTVVLSQAVGDGSHVACYCQECCCIGRLGGWATESNVKHFQTCTNEVLDSIRPRTPGVALYSSVIRSRHHLVALCKVGSKLVCISCG